MLFKPETERQISFNTGPAAYGSLITLTSEAYLEILNAARNWQASQQVASRWGEFRPLGAFQSCGIKPNHHDWAPNKEGDKNV